MTKYAKPYSLLLLVVSMYTILCISCTLYQKVDKVVKPTTEQITMVGKVDLATGVVELQGKSKLDIVEVGDNPSPTGKDGSMILKLWDMGLIFFAITLLLSFGIGMYVKVGKQLIPIIVNFTCIGLACLLTSYAYLDLIVTGLVALWLSNKVYDLFGKTVLNKTKDGVVSVLFRLFGNKGL